MSSISLVVFDIGNVLVEWQPEAYYDQVFGEAFRRKLFATVDLHAMNDEIDRGADFEATVRATADAHPAFSAAIMHWHDNWHLIAAPEITESAKTLKLLKKNNVSVSILSNIGEVPFEIACKAYPVLREVERPFLSGALKLNKPDPEIYASLEAATGVPPVEVLFVDDRLENIEAAKQRGWQVHHFQTAAGWRQDLADRGLI